jgi:hypothetical protein
MRRLLWAFLFTAASVGFLAAPAGADPAAFGNLNPIVLSYDFTNNSTSPAVSNGPNDPFNITVDVLPEHTAGVVKITAIAPDGSASIPLVCAFQPVQQSQIQCFFNFTTNGLWSIRAVFAQDAKSTIEAVAVTVLRVGS